MAGRQKRTPALQVLKAVYFSVRSMLGPRKMLKCCFSDDPNEEQLFNDTMQLLRKLVVEHPVYDLLFDLCHSHHEVWGCGTTTLAVLSILWTEEASRLVDQGVPLPCIVFWFRKSIETCKAVSAKNAFTVSNIFEQFEAYSDPTLQQLLATAVSPIGAMATTGTKPPPSTSSPSSTRSSHIPFQPGRPFRPVYKPHPTRKTAGVNRYSRYALPSDSKERVTGTNMSVLFTERDTPAVTVSGRLAVGASFATFPTAEGAMATVSHGNSFSEVLPSIPSTSKLGTFLKNAHQLSEGGHTMSVNCPAPATCPTPANCPAPVGDQPCTKCRHCSVLEYLVSALCPAQHRKARELVVQCMMLQCCGGKGAGGHGKFDRCCIQTERITGPSEELSIILPCVMVARISSDFVTLVQELHDCSHLRLLTLSGDLVAGYTHKGMKVTQGVREVTSVNSHGLRGEMDQWMEEVLAVLKKLSIRLLAVKGITSHDVIMTCLSHDIIVVDRIGMEKLVHLSDASGSEILCYAQHAEEASVGCIRGVEMMTTCGWERQRVWKKKAAERHHLYQTVQYCKLLLKVPSKELQVVICAHSLEHVNLLECDFRKCLLRIEAAFCTNATLVPGGGWVESACVRALEEEVAKGRQVGVQSCEWNHAHGPPWMGPLCYEFREVVIQGVIDGLRSFLTTLAHNVCAEGNGGVEAYLKKVAEPSGCLPGVLDLGKMKDEVWTKVVDFICLANRGMR